MAEQVGHGLPVVGPADGLGQDHGDVNNLSARHREGREREASDFVKHTKAPNQHYFTVSKCAASYTKPYGILGVGLSRQIPNSFAGPWLPRNTLFLEGC